MIEDSEKFAKDDEAKERKVKGASHSCCGLSQGRAAVICRAASLRLPVCEPDQTIQPVAHPACSSAASFAARLDVETYMYRMKTAVAEHEAAIDDQARLISLLLNLLPAESGFPCGPGCCAPVPMFFGTALSLASLPSRITLLFSLVS